jgi:hypothetical protein
MAVFSSTERRRVMGIKFDAESSRHPTVIWVDANKHGDAVNLIFGRRIEGQGIRKISNFS